MIIGSEFNRKCEKLLLKAAELSCGETDTKLSVAELNVEFGFDRTELRSYLEYLNDRNYIELISIGGPLLYGHISMTRNGIGKVNSIRENSGSGR